MSTMQMNLVFRLGDIGFALPIGNLIEICEGIPEWLEPPPVDSGGELLGRLLFRGRGVPVFNLRKRLGLPAGDRREPLNILILGDTEAPWGLAVEQVEGIFPTHEFAVHELPLLLRRKGQDFDSLDVWRGEPLVHVDLARISSGRPAA